MINSNKTQQGHFFFENRTADEHEEDTQLPFALNENCQVEDKFASLIIAAPPPTVSPPWFYSNDSDTMGMRTMPHHNVQAKNITPPITETRVQFFPQVQLHTHYLPPPQPVDPWEQCFKNIIHRFNHKTSELFRLKVNQEAGPNRHYLLKLQKQYSSYLTKQSVFGLTQAWQEMHTSNPQVSLDDFGDLFSKQICILHNYANLYTTEHEALNDTPLINQQPISAKLERIDTYCTVWSYYFFGLLAAMTEENIHEHIRDFITPRFEQLAVNFSSQPPTTQGIGAFKKSIASLKDQLYFQSISLPAIELLNKTQLVQTHSPEHLRQIKNSFCTLSDIIYGEILNQQTQRLIDVLTL